MRFILYLGMNTCAKYRLFSHEYFPSRFTGIISVHNYGKIHQLLFIYTGIKRKRNFSWKISRNSVKQWHCFKNFSIIQSISNYTIGFIGFNCKCLQVYGVMLKGELDGIHWLLLEYGKGQNEDLSIGCRNF